MKLTHKIRLCFLQRFLVGSLIICVSASLQAGTEYEAGAILLKHTPPKQPIKAQPATAPLAPPPAAGQQFNTVTSQMQPALSLSRVHVTGLGRTKDDTDDIAAFRSDTPRLYLRFEYRHAREAEVITAVWNHRPGQEASGAGAFAFSQLALKSGEAQGQFTFAPKGGGWYPGDYGIDLYTGNLLIGQVPFRIQGRPGQGSNSRGGMSVIETVLAKGIKNRRPNEPVKEYSDMWKRLVLWTRIDGGSEGGQVTARWLTGKRGGREQARSTKQIRPGENWIAYWLHFTPSEKQLPIGDARIELRMGKETLKTVHYRVRETGLFESIGDAFEQAGHEFKWLMDQDTE